MSGPCSRIAGALRRAAVPLAAYYAVTLALPLANGAASGGAPFAVHAMIVLIVPPVAIVLACGLYAIARACLRAAIIGAPDTGDPLPWPKTGIPPRPSSSASASSTWRCSASRPRSPAA